MEEMKKLPELRELPSSMQSPVRRAKEALLEGKEELDNHQKNYQAGQLLRVWLGAC